MSFVETEIPFGSFAVEFAGVKYIAEEIEEEPWAIRNASDLGVVRCARVRLILQVESKDTPIPKIKTVITLPFTGDRKWEVWRALKRYRCEDCPKIEVDLIPAGVSATVSLI